MTAPKEFIGLLSGDETSVGYQNSLENFQRVLIDRTYDPNNATGVYVVTDPNYDDAFTVKKYLKKYAGKPISDAPITNSFFKNVLLSKIKAEISVYLGTLDKSDPAQSLVITAIGDKLSSFSSDEEAKKKLMKEIGNLDKYELGWMFLGGAKPASLNAYEDLGTLFVDKFIGLVNTDGIDEKVLAKDVQNLSIEEAINLNVVAESSSIGADVAIEYDDLSDDQLLKIRQCALISSLMNDYSPFKRYPLSWNNNREAFAGRIMPVVESADLFDPNSLVNYCCVSKRTKNFLLNPKSRSNNLYHKLFWVYTDSETGKLRESEIFLTTNIDDFKLESSVGNNTTLERAKIIRQTMSNGYGYAIKTIKIDYNGTNPSTASKDVKVSLTINLDNLKSIDAVCSLVKMGGGELIELKLYDLVTLPATQTVETIAHGSSPLKREYRPDYSRIRLKVWSLEDDGVGPYLDPSETENAMIIDLATIDHTLQRSDDASGKTTLSINYAGYFEQAMKDPYNDALAGDEIVTSRFNRRQAANNNILDNDCSDEIARSMFKIINETDRLEAEDNIANGSIIKRLFEKGRVYGYQVDADLIKSNTIGASLSPKQVYVTNVKPLGAINTNVSEDTTTQWWKDVFTNLKIDEADVRIGEEGITYTLDSDNLDNHFFYLGDLMYESMACLYEEGTADMRDFRKNLNLRFVVGTFSVPDPNDITKTVTINPLRIPVDMFFFTEWFFETIISKGVTSYPVGLFIKDLTQRLINDIIYDTCFSILSPDETPPTLRTSYFVDHRDDWFKSKPIVNPLGVWFDPYDPTNIHGLNLNYDEIPNILMTKRVNSHVSNSKNYCVLYQQFPSYFRQLKYERAGKLKNDPYTMTMYYGNNTKNTNYISNVSFTKTDSPHLREARYFNTNFGNLSLLANVYDLNFDIKSPKAITSLYPGVIINFILTDWSGETEHWFPTDRLGESDPHEASTRANIGDEYRRKPNDDKFASDSVKCLEVRNSLIDKLNELEEQTGIEAEKFERIYSSTQDSSTTERVVEVEASPPATEESAADAERRVASSQYDEVLLRTPDASLYDGSVHGRTRLKKRLQTSDGTQAGVTTDNVTIPTGKTA